MGTSRLVASVTMYSRVDDSNLHALINKVELRVGEDSVSGTGAGSRVSYLADSH